MWRHFLSALALAPFALLALGSGDSEPAPVQVKYDGPDKLNAGQLFPFKLRLTNNGDAPFVVSEVKVDGDLVRGIQPLLRTAVSNEPYGDQHLYRINPLTVAPGASAAVEFEGTPYLDGQSGSVHFCDAGGTCYKGWISSSVAGAPEESLVTTWTMPAAATVGQPATIKASVKNVSGGADTLESLGWDDDLSKRMSLQGSTPYHKGEASEILYDAWSFDVLLKPNETVDIELTVVPNSGGVISGDFATCLASEAFCAKQKQTFTVQ